MTGEIHDMISERDRQLQAFLAEILEDSVAQILADEGARIDLPIWQTSCG